MRQARERLTGAGSGLIRVKAAEPPRATYGRACARCARPPRPEESTGLLLGLPLPSLPPASLVGGRRAGQDLRSLRKRGLARRGTGRARSCASRAPAPRSLAAGGSAALIPNHINSTGEISGTATVTFRPYSYVLRTFFRPYDGDRQRCEGTERLRNQNRKITAISSMPTPPANIKHAQPTRGCCVRRAATPAKDKATNAQMNCTRRPRRCRSISLGVTSRPHWGQRRGVNVTRILNWSLVPQRGQRYSYLYFPPPPASTIAPMIAATPPIAAPRMRRTSPSIRIRSSG